MDTDELEDALSVLDRADVLACCRDNPCTRSEIVDRTDRSRATVYRTTTELSERGMLAETVDGFVTTDAGVVMVAAAGRAINAKRSIDNLGPLLERIDSPELAANAHQLADAEVVVANETNPYAPADRAMELWQQSARVRVVTTATGSREALIEGTRLMVESDISVDLCYTPTLLDTFRTVAPELLEETVAEPNVRMHNAEELPFSFAIHDDVASVTATGETGSPTAIAMSENPGARVWLEELFADCWSRSTPITESVSESFDN